MKPPRASTDSSRTRGTARAREYSVDDLARASGTTVRNVRAYQDRKLLPPPERRGRLGVYTESHLARLRVINRMLERGYSLGNIAELIDAWERGHEIGDLLGLEAAITSPWNDEEPALLSIPDLVQMFGARLPAAALAKAHKLKLLEPDGLGYRVSSMKLLEAGAELAREGIPLEELLDIVGALRENVDRVASSLVQLVVRYVFDRYGRDKLPPASDVPRLADLVWRLRPLAMKAVDSEVARAMEKAANRFLGDRLSAVLDHLHDKP
jgi:DNA-binding transcriptional MerR regulator